MTDLSAQLARVAEAHARIDVQEGRITKLETHAAVATERSEHIQKSLDKIESGQSWLIRLILGAIILAVIAFAMKGGLNVGQ